MRFIVSERGCDGHDDGYDAATRVDHRLGAILHRRPAMRTGVALAIAAVLLAIAGCGGSGTKVVHLGCHQYCQQAGGYGGGPAGAPTVKFDSRGDVPLGGDGTVTIKLTCLMPVPCNGAVVIAPAVARLEFVCKPTVGRINWWGQSDLTLAAEQTEAIAVPLSACAQQQLSKRGRVKVFVIADTRRIPACSKIPALTQACHRFVTGPGYTADQGDGLNRLVTQDLVLVSPGS